MKVFLFVIVVAFISNATATSDENYRSSSEENESSSSEENADTSTDESTECKISYTYTIWIGDNVDEVHSVNLQSKCGIVFLEAMQQAAEKKEQFAFEHTAHPLFGSFVTQIDGVANDDEAKTYWMIYDLATEPNVGNSPDDEYLSSVGVSSLKVLNGHSYLFWYKTVDDDDEDYN